MAALTATTPSNAGTVSAAAAVSASDTVAQAVLGPRGAYLKIVNSGAGTDNITITDYGTTGAGNQLPSNTLSASVANAGVSKVFLLQQGNVNPSTGLITITHSVSASVTYELWTI
jgi:hypothetical protein